MIFKSAALLAIFSILIVAFNVPRARTEIGGVHYIFWNFPIERFNSLYVDIRVDSEPDNGDGLYFQMYQGTINGIGFYFGLQTQTYKPGVGFIGKGLIFSRWGTRDLSNVRVVAGGWAESAGYEGDFVGVRRTYEWTTHDYRFRIALNDSDEAGDWYAVWINDLTTGTSDLLGALRFPKTSPEQSGIADGGITWTELYWKAVSGTPLPNWHISILGIFASDQEIPPVECTSAYSSWTNNSDIYCDEERTIHFLMGPNVIRLHPPSDLFSAEPDTTPPMLSNLQQSPPGSRIESNLPIIVTLEADDYQSGIKRLVLSHRTSKDGEEWSDWVDITMDNIGGNTWCGAIPAYGWQTHIQYKVTAYDKRNNPSSTNLLSITVTEVSNIPPVTRDDYDGKWRNKDFRITLTSIDHESGVAETYYRINDGQVKALSTDGQPLITTEGANNTLEYWSVDNAGNEEPHKILKGIKLDKTEPLSSISLEGIMGENDWFVSNVTATLMASDALSGVDSILYSFDNVKWENYVGPVQH